MSFKNWFRRGYFPRLIVLNRDGASVSFSFFRKGEGGETGYAEGIADVNMSFDGKEIFPNYHI